MYTKLVEIENSVYAHVARQKSRDKIFMPTSSYKKSLKFSATFIARCQHKHFCRAFFVAQNEHKRSLMLQLKYSLALWRMLN